MPHRPTPSRPFVRLVLAISLDGRLAPPPGGAAQLGGEGDRRALEHALAWGDACLIGAGTLRAHQCTCLIRSPQLLEQRRSEGRAEQPVAVVVSRSPDFPSACSKARRSPSPPSWAAPPTGGAKRPSRLMASTNRTKGRDGAGRWGIKPSIRRQPRHQGQLGTSPVAVLRRKPRLHCSGSPAIAPCAGWRRWP